MRISRPDPEDPTGTKRRHFEISIDSPFTILNCRATQANTALPRYSAPDECMFQTRTACGCPDAAVIAPGQTTSAHSSTGSLHNLDRPMSHLDGSLEAFMRSPLSPQAPQAAHLQPASPQTPSREGGTPPQSQDGEDTQPRPIHLLRVPSYNPPAFDAEQPPPPAEIAAETPDPRSVMTPPPQYDVIIGTPSVDGMADYFARLADYGFDPREDDSDSADDEPARALTRSGRVTVAHPRTPGGRAPSRSLEIERPPISLSLEAMQAARIHNNSTPTPTEASGA
jgi:arrestin-related trafficking adapter 3/6